MMADWWAAHGDIAMIKRAWRRVIDHIGGFGVFIAVPLVGLTAMLWSTWTWRGIVALWFAVYAKVREIRERDRRKAAARKALDLMFSTGKTTTADIETIRKGLS